MLWNHPQVLVCINSVKKSDTATSMYHSENTHKHTHVSRSRESSEGAVAKANGATGCMHENMSFSVTMTLNVNFPPSFAGINVALEVFGRNSRCFEQGKPFEMRFSGTVISQSTYGAGCYEVCPSCCL